MVLIIVAIPAAVILAKSEGQNGTARETDGFAGREDRLPGLVAAVGPDVDAPGGLDPLPSLAKPTGPVTRLRLLRSS